MEKQVWKGSTLLAPVPPVLVSCGSMQQPNAITIAWTGIINSQPPKTYISVRPERFSYDIIKSTGEFVINLPTQSLVRAVDWCGVKSGREVNKFEAMQLTAQQASQIACPMISESPVSLECKVSEIVPLGTHDMFIADIVAVNVAENLLDSKGKLHLGKAGLIAYAHGEYYTLGKRIGSFGCSVKKKK